MLRLPENWAQRGVSEHEMTAHVERAVRTQEVSETQDQG